MFSERDHRSMGARLDLFHFQEEAPGMVFWHPRGLALFRILEDHVRERMRLEGYREVRTPQLLSRSLWQRSGHWDNFRENFFVIPEADHGLAVKPVSCPGHIELVKRMAPSYRNLPIRLGEFGLCHRLEPSGALQGLFRLRQFTQDDGHVFCAEEDVEAEVERFGRGLQDFYGLFGFERIEVGLSLRPALRAGQDKVWDRAESALESAARRVGLDFVLQPGQGAFYGPKLEFSLRDDLGRAWQCGTIQLDFVLPERFELSYIDRDGAPRRMVMLHRALLGSLERFLGILLEHHAGLLPPWLAPAQFVLAPVAEAYRASALVRLERLHRAGFRGELDCRNESLSRKVLDAHALGIPWFLAFGKREAEGEAVSLREREGERRVMGLHQALDWMRARGGSPSNVQESIQVGNHRGPLC